MGMLLTAKATFSQLLRLAKNGAQTIIMSRGRPPARKSRLAHEYDVAEARAAAERIRALAREARLGPFDWKEWKGYRDEGRH